MALFPAGDGKTVMLGLQNEREWKVFCEKVLLQPGLGHDERFPPMPNAVPSARSLSSMILRRSQADGHRWRSVWNTAGIANAQVNTMAEVWAHPAAQGARSLDRS
jgi:itaconate CoA-transferase